jgi:hypothetical protein
MSRAANNIVRVSSSVFYESAPPTVLFHCSVVALGRNSSYNPSMPPKALHQGISRDEIEGFHRKMDISYSNLLLGQFFVSPACVFDSL